MERNAGGDGARPRARLERLATRVDDRYTLWQLLQDGAESPEQDRQRAELERQLRSPRDQAGQSSLEESRKPGPADAKQFERIHHKFVECPAQEHLWLILADRNHRMLPTTGCCTSLNDPASQQ